MSASCAFQARRPPTPSGGLGIAVTELPGLYSHRLSARAGKGCFQNRRQRRRSMSGQVLHLLGRSADWWKGDLRAREKLFARKKCRTGTKIVRSAPLILQTKKRGTRVRASLLLQLPQAWGVRRKRCETCSTWKTLDEGLRVKGIVKPLGSPHLYRRSRPFPLRFKLSY